MINFMLMNRQYIKLLEMGRMIFLTWYPDMYRTFPPPPQLARHVRMFWVFEHDVPQGEPYVYRSMADGCAEMVFHYKGLFSGLDADDHPYHPAVLHAQSNRHRRFLTHGSFGIFGAYLYPSALPQLFGLSSAAFSNQVPELAAVLSTEGRFLQEQVMLAASHARRVQILSKFLLERLHKRRQDETAAHVAIRHIIAAKGQVNVTALASQICLSTRQFERKFKEFGGFSPKMYARIIRFQGALAEYGNSPRSMTDIAYACGYYDQSHFIHEFREFSGYHPRQYFSGRPEGIEYREG